MLYYYCNLQAFCGVRMNASSSLEPTFISGDGTLTGTVFARCCSTAFSPVKHILSSLFCSVFDSGVHGGAPQVAVLNDGSLLVVKSAMAATQSYLIRNGTVSPGPAFSASIAAVAVATLKPESAPYFAAVVGYDGVDETLIFMNSSSSPPPPPFFLQTWVYANVTVAQQISRLCTTPLQSCSGSCANDTRIAGVSASGVIIARRRRTCRSPTRCGAPTALRLS